MLNLTNLNEQINLEFAHLGLTSSYKVRAASVVFTLVNEKGEFVGRARACKFDIQFMDAYSLGVKLVDELKEEGVY